MTLLSKASIIATPTAYGDGVLNSVKPTDGDGDFDFARASSATRVNEEGLIEKERENTTTYSQDATNWSSVNLTRTSTSELDAFGGNNAAEYEVSSITSAAYFYRTTSPSWSSGQVVTGSIYIKDVDQRYVQLTFGTAAFGVSQYQNFDLQTGTKGTGLGMIDSTITLIGNGWYRLTITAQTTVSGASGVIPCFVPSSSAVRLQAPSILGRSLQAFGFQTEQGLVATDYIETTTTSVAVGITNDIPRINYENGIGNFLLEPQRTNLLQQSEYVNGSQDVSNVTITTNATTSPDGKINASKIVPNTSNTFHWFGETVSGSAGVYTASVFAKADTYNHLYIVLRTDGGVNRYGVKFDLSTGLFLDDITYALPTQTNYAIEDYGNGWYRCSVMAYNTIGNVVALFGPSLGGLLFDINNSFAGNGTSGIYVWGAQLEDGYITSYIPCYGSATTRAAETCNNAGNSDLFNDSEGVLYAEVSFSDRLTAKAISISGGSFTNRVLFYLSTSGNLSAYTFVGGVNQCNITVGGYNYSDISKLALKYKENDFALWINGVEVGTDTSGTTFSAGALTELSFDANGAGADVFYGKIKMVATFKEALSDSELECLTTI